ncbi:MAG: GGDEF domain-containing response regulator [Armatimonadetes bacterium]|nr:GGDEF domain-containing response regulator [Armatimonadota bacterium]
MREMADNSSRDQDSQGTESLTVALVEDNRDHALIAAEALEERGHHVVHFERGEDVLAASQTREWDAVVLDYVLPTKSGLEVLEALGELSDSPPVVMVTASGSEAVAVTALKKGAGDYVVKTGRHGPELARAVELAATKHRMEQMAAAHRKELERRANTDALTGLLNRRRLADELGIAALRSSQSGEPYAVVMIDLDGFKKINDEYGHAIGDAVLVEFADILRGCFRKYDILARYGGDEFVVVLPNATRSCLPSLIERVTQGLSNSKLVERLEFPLSASVGVADSEVGGPEDVLKAADRTMYRHKNRANRTASDSRDLELDSAVIVE